MNENPTSTAVRLDGRVAVVTDAGQGLGRSFALDVLDRLVIPSTAGHVAALFEKDIALADVPARGCGADITDTTTLASSFVAGLRRAAT